MDIVACEGIGVGDEQDDAPFLDAGHISQCSKKHTAVAIPAETHYNKTGSNTKRG